MEDPIKFNLWGRIVPEKREEALEIIRGQAVFPSEIELRKAIAAAIRETRRVQVSAALGYTAVAGLADSVSEIFSALTLCQEGYPPSMDNRAYCALHNLHFGGILGCHICRGFYSS